MFIYGVWSEVNNESICHSNFRKLIRLKYLCKLLHYNIYDPNICTK